MQDVTVQMTSKPEADMWYRNRRQNKDTIKQLKWLDGRHSDNLADTWAWVFAHCVHFCFLLLFCLALRFYYELHPAVKHFFHWAMLKIWKIRSFQLFLPIFSWIVTPVCWPQSKYCYAWLGTKPKTKIGFNNQKILSWFVQLSFGSSSSYLSNLPVRSSSIEVVYQIVKKIGSSECVRQRLTCTRWWIT